MYIINIRAMQGPNYWSVRKPNLIVMKLDLQELEQKPSNQIEGFYERLSQLIPSLLEHKCSENKTGGFLYRVIEGTWMGHVVEHVALELQTLAGMDCGCGRARETREKGVYHVVFEYQEENAGRYAAAAAVSLTEGLIIGKDMARLQEELENHLMVLRRIKAEEGLGPSTGSIVQEARKRGIPCTRLDNNSLVMLGYGSRQQRLEATITGRTSNIAVDIACDKKRTKALLDNAGIPVPKGTVVSDEAELLRAVTTIGYPLVIKPLNGNHGNGACININSWEEALNGLRTAQQLCTQVIVERYIPGFDFRMLVINYKLVAVARRTPAAITGDGLSSIRQLIDLVNSDPRRGQCHENVLTAIRVDEATLGILAAKNLTLDSVLRPGETLYLKETANLSTGGTATDVTDEVHPLNARMAERIARIIGLDICGIDVMAPDVHTPLSENGGAVLEVNAAPGFRMHLAPTEGKARNVAAAVIDMLFPAGRPATIPIVAVTGTNGKTTTTRLVAHIARTAGHRTGYSTTEGIYIDNDLVEVGDCTGPQSARLLLGDPAVDFAVLECARGGILRAGLGFNQCDVGIVTNVADDHLGQNDIHTLEQLTSVKAVVPESVTQEGYAVLNAEDDRVYAMADDLTCRIALFGLSGDHPRLVQHCSRGGLSAFVEDGWVVIAKDSQRIYVEALEQIPITYEGRALFMVRNVLAAVLAAYAQDIAVDTIRQALRSFLPSPEQTPGRMNLFRFRNFEVLVDYAHNPAGFAAIGEFLERTPASSRIGLICGTGDRRDEDLIAYGRAAAPLFDEIIIRHDKDSRGRNPQEMVQLLTKGVRESYPDKPIRVIPHEEQAIHYTIDRAMPGSLVVICCDNVFETIEMVRRQQNLHDQWETELRAMQA